MQPHWVKNPPTTMTDKVRVIKDNTRYFRTKGPRGRCIRQLIKEVKEEHALITEAAREQQPLAFFKPSYEQALILNSWMYGIAFNCVYTSNRIGKTVAGIINMLLWIIPNDPTWEIFKPYTDQFGRLVQVFPRPNISSIKRIAKYIKTIPTSLHPNPALPTYDPINKAFLQSLQTATTKSSIYPHHPLHPAWPEHPWLRGGTIWFGAPDHDHHEKILFPLWKQYIPKNLIDRYSPSQKEISLRITSNAPATHPKHQPRITCWELVGKSYESKDTKWSSGAVDAIVLTEGVTAPTMKEIKLRFKDPGIGSHDFTPYEAANSGAASHLAHQIYKGIEVLPISTFVFTKFSMRMAPDHIISPDKKAGLIASFEGTDEGKARIDGEFYTSSSLVLSNLSRQIHLLPYSPQQFKLLYNSSSNPTLNHTRPIQHFRGLDPGLDHPTACAFSFLLPTNQHVIYQIFSERNLNIPQRVARIIQSSGNEQRKIYFDGNPNDPNNTNFYTIETHPNPPSPTSLGSTPFVATLTDYHTFKEDEVTGQEYALNYILQGLQIQESTHIGPEERALSLDSDLHPSPYLPSLTPTEEIAAIFHAWNRSPSNHGTLPPAYSALQSLQTTTRNSQSQPSSALPLQGMPPGAKVYFLQYGMGILATFLKWEDFYWERKKSGEDKGQPKDSIPSHGDDELDAVTYITCSQYKWTNYQPPARVEGDSESEDDLVEWAQAHNHSPNTQSSSPSLQSLQTKAPQAPQAIHIFGDEQVIQSHVTRNSTRS